MSTMISSHQHISGEKIIKYNTKNLQYNDYEYTGKDENIN